MEMLKEEQKQRLTFAPHFPVALCYLQLPTISKLYIFGTLDCIIDSPNFL